MRRWVEEGLAGLGFLAFVGGTACWLTVAEAMLH